MKSQACVLSIGLALAVICHAQENPGLQIGATIPEFNGYKDVRIQKVEPDGIRIIHEFGAAKIPIESLSPSQKEALGLTGAGAEEYRRKQAEQAKRLLQLEQREMLNQQMRRNQASQQQAQNTQTSTPIPALSDAQAKVAAFEAWVSQGGGLSNPYAGGRGNPELRAKTTYRSGPMKGLTKEQARQKFEAIWESTPENVKEKYRKRAADGYISSQGEPSNPVTDTSGLDDRIEELRQRQDEIDRKQRELRQKQEDAEIEERMRRLREGE